MGDFRIKIYCPYPDCKKSKVYSTGKANLKTSEVCPVCRRTYTVDWRELIAYPSPKIKNTE